MLERKEERNDMIKALIQNIEKIIIGKRNCIDIWSGKIRNIPLQIG